VVDRLYGPSAEELDATFKNVSRHACSYYSPDLSVAVYQCTLFDRIIVGL